MFHRSLLSLVAALFFSTLASANSTNVSTALLHSGGFDRPNYAGHFSTIGGTNAPTMFVAGTSHASTGAFGGEGLGAAFSSGATGSHSGRILLPEPGYGPICCDARTWVSGGGTERSRPALSTPEPSSLMLLSTGLMGIAGLVRRKLRRG